MSCRSLMQIIGERSERALSLVMSMENRDICIGYSRMASDNIRTIIEKPGTSYEPKTLALLKTENFRTSSKLKFREAR